MSREDIKERVQAIFRDIFDDASITITDNTTSDDIEEWDSLNHINLIGAIEGEFKIKFALGELQEMKNVGVMLDLIMQKINH